MLLRRKLRLTSFSVQQKRHAKHTPTVENVSVTLTDVATGEYFISQLSFESRQLWGIALFHQNLSTHRNHPQTWAVLYYLGFIAKRVTSHTRPYFISHNPVLKMHLFKLLKPRQRISISTATVLQSKSCTEHKAPGRAQTHTKSKIMSVQVLSEAGGRGCGGKTDGYTSLFTGHFLWLSLGGIIRQTNSSQRLGDVTQDPKKRKKKNQNPHMPCLHLTKQEPQITALSSSREQVRTLSLPTWIETVIFFFYIITTLMCANHSLLPQFHKGKRHSPAHA